MNLDGGGQIKILATVEGINLSLKNEIPRLPENIISRQTANEQQEKRGEKQKIKATNLSKSSAGGKLSVKWLGGWINLESTKNCLIEFPPKSEEEEKQKFKQES